MLIRIEVRRVFDLTDEQDSRKGDRIRKVAGLNVSYMYALFPFAVVNLPPIKPSVYPVPRLTYMSNIPPIGGVDISKSGLLAFQRSVSMTHKRLTEIFETITEMLGGILHSFGGAQGSAVEGEIVDAVYDIVQTIEF